MSNNNKISDELLIAYIENGLSKDDRKSLETALQNDDKVYLRFIDLYHSMKEIEEAKLEVTPDIVLSRALPSNKQPKLNVIKARLFALLNSLIAPKRAISLAVSMGIILFIITNIDQNQSNDFDNDNKETIDNILKDFGSTQMSPTVFKSQEISISKNTIEFKPELKISNQLVLISLDGDTLLNKLITKKTSSVKLSDDLIGQLPLKVKVVLISGDSIKNKIISQ